MGVLEEAEKKERTKEKSSRQIKRAFSGDFEVGETLASGDSVEKREKRRETFFGLKQGEGFFNCTKGGKPYR